MSWLSNKQTWRFCIGRLSVSFTYHYADGFMGRFGGGWTTKCGMLLSVPSKLVVFELFVISVRVQYLSKP